MRDKLAAIDSENIRAHLQHLTEAIGPRLAGSPSEAVAADYIAEQFSRCGADVRLESFPVYERQVKNQELQLRLREKWHKSPCSAMNGSPGTGGEYIEAPLAVIEPPELRQNSYSGYAGKAVLILGTHLENPEHYKRLMAVKPACLIMIDVRYPADTLRADGLFPAYIHRYGAVPSVTMPFMQAWELYGADRVKLRIDGDRVAGNSQNVIATFAAKQAGEGPVVFAGGHHDTQADSLGADDNGSGVAAILEMARVLGAAPRTREICLISFGAEEQLSVGSAAYVRTHRDELTRRGGFMCNFDGFGSRLGWYMLHICADTAAMNWFNRRLESSGQYAEIIAKAVPYQDAFPFHAAGLPGFWLYRPNCASGRFYHHQADDDLAKMDVGRMSNILQPLVEACAVLADADTIPFPMSMPAELQASIRQYWEDCFGGWEGFSL